MSLLDTVVPKAGSWQNLSGRKVMSLLPKSSMNVETDQQVDVAVMMQG